MERASGIDLGPALAMPDGAAKTTAINQACAEMRETYCPAGKDCTAP